VGPDIVEHLSKLLKSGEIASDNPKMLHHQDQHHRPQLQKDSKVHPLVVIHEKKKGLPISTSMPRLISCFASSTPQQLVASYDPEKQQQKRRSLSQRQPPQQRFTAPSIFTLVPEGFSETAVAADDEVDKAQDLTLPTRRGDGGGFHTNLSLLLKSQDAALKLFPTIPNHMSMP
jgi:hypothetical protein